MLHAQPGACHRSNGTAFDSRCTMSWRLNSAWRTFKHHSPTFCREFERRSAQIANSGLTQLVCRPSCSAVVATKKAPRKSSKLSAKATLIATLPRLELPALQELGEQAGAAAGNNQLQRQVLLGIDPDLGGALAVVRWSGAGSMAPADTTVDMYDMPIMQVKAGKRLRRQADAQGIALLVSGLLPSLRGQQSVGVRTILEQPAPNSLNGKYSWWSSGFSYGVWSGVLQSLGLEVETVSARRWKQEMLLNGKGKEGSRLLAQHLFPHAAESLKRKKDHGRAEAMLIAAWASGLRPEALPEAVAAVLEPAEAAPKDSIDTASPPDTAKSTQHEDPKPAEPNCDDSGCSLDYDDDSEAAFLDAAEGEFCDGEVCELDFGSEDDEE